MAKKKQSIEDKIGKRYVDLTKTGPLSYRELRTLNNNLPEESELNAQYPSGNVGVMSAFSNQGGYGYTESPSDYEESVYDPGMAGQYEYENLQDIRAEEEPWYGKVANGILKGTILAGTTFLDGTIGLLYGAEEAIRKGDVSQLWDNEFSRALQSVNEWSEKALPNYYSYSEQNDPWYTNIFTANFWGDKFIKNLGFSVGALYSGSVMNSVLGIGKFAKLVGTIANSTKAPSFIASGIGATISAVNEGRIEALNNSKDWAELKRQELDDAWSQRLSEQYAPQEQALKDEYTQALKEFEATKGKSLRTVNTPDGKVMVDPAQEKFDRKIAELQQRRAILQENKLRDWEDREGNEAYAKTLGKIEEDRAKMGNMDLALNIPILTASNIVQFARFYARGFDTARRTGVNATGSLIDGTRRYTGKEFKKRVLTGKILKGALSEGSEEINQKAAATTAGYYYNPDVNNFYKAQIDPNAEQESLDWVKAAAKGIADTYGDGSSWEEFAIGALTGLLGVPSFRSMKNSKGEFQSPIKFEGGAFNEYRNYREEITRSAELADKLNQRVQSPEFLNYYRGLIRRTKYQNDKNNAAENNDKFEFENAEHSQFVSDIVMFDNAGRLDDLRDMIELATGSSTENINALLNGTVTTDNSGSTKSPFIDRNGNPLMTEDEVRDYLNKERKDALDVLDNYRKIKNDIDTATNGRLSNEQLSELTWIKSKIDNWSKRARKMTPSIKRVLNSFADTLETDLRRNLEGVDEKTAEVIHKVADDNGIRQKRIDNLRWLASLSDKHLRRVLSDPAKPESVEALADDIEDFAPLIMGDPDLDADANKVAGMVRDLPKINKGIEVYSKKLEEYLADPAKLEEANRRAAEEVAGKVQAEKRKTLRDNLSNAKNLNQFRDTLDQEDDSTLKDSLLTELESEGNQMAKNYRETRQYSDEVTNNLNNQLNSQEESQETVQDAMALWKRQTDKAQNLEQIANPNSLDINDPNSFMDNTTSPEDADRRFQNARYALQKAMEKANNDKRFGDRFSDEYKASPQKPPVRPNISTENSTTGASGTPTIPSTGQGTPSTSPSAPSYIPPVGDISSTEVADENKETNSRIEGQHDLEKPNVRRRFYRPAVPELHIDASKEGDFRIFPVVAMEREGKDFSIIWEYLRKNDAFDYVNSGKLTAEEPLWFMIDPEFEKSVEGKPWHTGPTVFFVTKDGQIVGSLDEGSSMKNYEGLEALIKRVRDEYQASRTDGSNQASTDFQIYGKFEDVATITSTNQGFTRNTDSQDWSSQVSDIRTKPDGWGEHKGLIYYKRTISGRGGDNTTIWLRTPLTEQGKRELEELFNNMSSITDENKAKLLKIINENQIAAPNRKEKRFIATPQTKVSKVMIGRVPYTSEDRSIQGIPGIPSRDNPDSAPEPKFGIIKNGRMDTNGKVADNLIIKPLSMAKKEGRLYLLIPNATGTYSPVALRVKHFNAAEFNLSDATVANTLVGQSLNTAIDMLATAVTEQDFHDARVALGQVLYNRDLIITTFSSEKGKGIVLSHKKRNPDGSYKMVKINGRDYVEEQKFSIYYNEKAPSTQIGGITISADAMEALGGEAESGEARDTEVVKREITEALMKFNLPIQVDVSRINTTGYNNSLIFSDVISSNLREAAVIGSWFTTDFFTNNGDLQKASNPVSSRPPQAPVRTPATPVGGQESVIRGTQISVGGVTYIVDLEHSIIYDMRSRTSRSLTAMDSLFIDLAWAQSNFGNATESSIMTNNKIITPDGRVLDRTAGRYLTYIEAQAIKDKIAGRNKASENKTAESQRILGEIEENQRKVDKSRTDNDNYYIIEDDGQYHPYMRVHSRLGDNWLGEHGNNSDTALKAGSAVDTVIRDFFNGKVPVRPDILSEMAFKALIDRLTEIKSQIDSRGETFMANNIVLFYKYPDGTRVAGEVDILSVDKNGNFHIYDVKTSRYSFSGRFFTNKSSRQRMSTKDYYTLQLSAYSNLFESQYGVHPVGLAIMPFVLTYDTRDATSVDIPSGSQTRFGQVIQGSPSYFRTDRKVGDEEVRYISSEKDGKVYFKPVIATEALKGNDAAKNAIEFIGGDPSEATSFVLVELGEAVRDSESGRVFISKKAKVFAVTPSTPYSGKVDIVTSIQAEKGIPITYNPNVNVPVTPRVVPSVPQGQSTVQTPPPVRTETPSNTDPLFDSSQEALITDKSKQDRTIPENNFDEGGKIGYYELDGVVYKGYLKKGGEVEVTLEGGQKVMMPVYIAKVRSRGFGDSFNKTSEYFPVFYNGKAIRTNTNSMEDSQAINAIMKAVSSKPDVVQEYSYEKTQIFNPQELEEAEIAQRADTYSQTEALSSQESTGGAAATIQEEDAANDEDDEFSEEFVLRKADSRSRLIVDTRKELAWLRRVLPQLSEQNRIRFVKGLIEVAGKGPIAWGMYSKGIITLSDIAADGTVYHEAFHLVMDLMFTPQEKEALFEEARRLYGDKPLRELEEDMAEGFREYVTSQRERGLGRRILDFFRNLFAKVTNWKYVQPSLINYYRMIDQGRYSKSELGTSNTQRLRQEEYDIRFREISEEYKKAASQMRREAQRFLDNFGITIKEVQDFGGEEKLFDALNRVINIRNVDDISEGVGEAIAFMMQYNNTMGAVLGYRIKSTPKNIRRSIRNRGDFNASINPATLNPEVKRQLLKEIGSDIASELRKLYNVEPINVQPETFLSKLWEVIVEFFNKLTPEAKTKFNVLRNYTKSIANSVKLNDPSIILSTDYKPGTTEKAAIVNIAKAFQENPYEEGIIKLMSANNIALAGGASIALEGLLYRPSENPLHDLDFNAVDYSKEELDNLIKREFPNSIFIREIVNGQDKFTETYLVLDRPFATRRPIEGVAAVEIYDEKTGKKLGSYVGSELFLEEGVKGKFLDFFLGKDNNKYPYRINNINGSSYLVADPRSAFAAKIKWARLKDIWDYNRFNSRETFEVLKQRRQQEIDRIKRLLKEARIIWGHPAIGKTTYLERNQDILEWDQEVNPKRNEFIRNQIDPEHKLDVASKEYKNLRSAYMADWRNHPEYVKFLTDEWEALKKRAQREGKKLFASPTPLLEIGINDFDMFVALPQKVFLERNRQRGGTPMGSLGWKQVVDDALTRVDPDKIVYTDKYFSEFMRDNLGVQWGTLSEDEVKQLESRGWTKEKFDSISQRERDHAVECAGL